MRPQTPLNIPIAVASFVLSFLLWLIIGSQNAPALQSLAYPLSLSVQGLDSAKFVITSNVPKSQTIFVKGTPNQLAALGQQSPVGVIDLRGATAGRRTYPVQLVPASAKLYFNGNPPPVLVDIEPITSRRIKVSLDAGGELNDPLLRLDQTLIDPETVVVTGPKSDVDRVAKARVLLDLTKVHPGSRESYTLAVEALTTDNKPVNRVTFEPTTVRVNAVLSPASDEKAIFVVPSFINQPAAGYGAGSYEVEPRRIQVKGRSLDLASLTKVQTDPVDLKGLTADTTMRVGIKLPKGLTSDTSIVKITVRITPLSLMNSNPNGGQ